MISSLFTSAPHEFGEIERADRERWTERECGERESGEREVEREPEWREG